MLIIIEVSCAAELAGHRDAMDALAGSVPDGSFFETSEWLTSWLEAFWEPRPAAILLAYDAGELVGIAPFLPDTDGTAWCRGTLTLPHHSHIPRANVIAREGRRAEVFEACLDHIGATRGSVTVALASVDRDGPLVDDAAAVVRARQLRTQVFPGVPMPWIRLAGNWDEYMQSRSSHVRTELRRKRRKFDKAGCVLWTTVTQPDGVEAAMRDVMTIERNSWKHAAGSAFTSEPGVGGFYAALARRAALRGWLKLHVLYLDGQPVAHVLAVAHRNAVLALKTSFDESRRDLSPGVVVFTYALEDAFGSGHVAFDLLGVESRWKNELATDVRHPATVCVFARHAVRCQACRAYHQDVRPFVARHARPLVALKRALARAEPQGRQAVKRTGGS